MPSVYCERTARPAGCYAAALQQAVLKALGTGFSSGIGFQDVSVEVSWSGPRGSV